MKVRKSMIIGENKRVCCICGIEFKGMGNNPAPVMVGKTNRCCDMCNHNIIIPRRIMDYMKNKQN